MNLYGEGFLNTALFDKVLRDYDTITRLSFVFQLLLLAMSFITTVAMITFFNRNDIKKISILKANGANNRNILKIKIYQYLIMLGFGLLGAIPLAVLFVAFIIKNTYHLGIIKGVNWGFIFVFVLFNLLLIALFFIAKFKLDLDRLNKYSLASLMKDIQDEKKNLKIPFKNFTFRQLSIQLLHYKKISIMCAFSLVAALLLIMMSNFIEKETAGIWDGDTDYYISA